MKADSSRLRASAIVLSWQLPFLALVVTGWFGDVEGARNLVTFAVWGFLLPLGLTGALSVALQAALALGPGLPAPVCWFFHAANIVCLGVLVWHGSTLTGVAFAIYLAASQVGAAAVRTMRPLLDQIRRAAPSVAGRKDEAGG